MLCRASLLSYPLGATRQLAGVAGGCMDPRARWLVVVCLNKRGNYMFSTLFGPGREMRPPQPSSWLVVVHLRPVGTFFGGSILLPLPLCCFLLPLSVLVFFHPPFPTHVSNACGRMSQQGATRPTTEGKYLDPVASARHKQACWTHKVARMGWACL